MDPTIVSTPAGSSLDIDIDKPTVTTPAAQPNAEFLQKLPEGFAEKEWVKALVKHQDPVAELFKEHDNQLSLVGRKSEGLKVPGEGATPEERQAFHKAIGVPENLDDYKYEPPTVPDKLKEFFAQDDDLQKAMKAACQKAGVTAAGWKEIAGAFDAYYLAELEKTVDANAQTMNQLEAEFSKRYGDRSKTVLDQWGMLSKMAPDWAAPVFEGLAAPVKVALAAWADQVAAKYIKEDKLDMASAVSGHTMTQHEYGNEYERLYSVMRKYTPGSPEHVKANQDLKALREKASEIFKTKA